MCGTLVPLMLSSLIRTVTVQRYESGITDSRLAQRKRVIIRRTLELGIRANMRLLVISITRDSM